ncbi:hypothetical protein GGQ81_000368 [Sphingomonas desiccabilis]|nr:hypothetical protein [Sphingomonas desiccabilis]
MRSEDLVTNSQSPTKTQLLKSVSDAIEGLINALDRFHGDPDLEPEEDIGADDLGEPELDGLMR